MLVFGFMFWVGIYGDNGLVLVVICLWVLVLGIEVVGYGLFVL